LNKNLQDLEKASSDIDQKEFEMLEKFKEKIITIIEEILKPKKEYISKVDEGIKNANSKIIFC
jgi:hypothetical protein